MKISGLQKLTLLDFPGHVACTVFFAGCDLRCPFCHNAPLVTEIDPDDISMSEEEFFKFLKKRKGILDGVAITGGEPLLRPDIVDFIKKIRDLGYAVKLDTNGTHPDLLEKILSEKLVDYVAMDIKNSPEKYAETVGVNIDISLVKRSVALIMSSEVDYEFRTTVVRELHCESDFSAIGQWIWGAKRYFLQQFTDSGALIEKSKSFTAASRSEMENFAKATGLTSVSLRGVRDDA